MSTPACQVSVVMPVYNAESFLQAAVESVLQQTFSNFELIAVDDGSTDQSARILSAFGDSRLRVIAQQNQGQSAAINAGMRVSVGRFLKIMDADDWINSQHLESQVRSLDSCCDCVSSCAWGYFQSDFRSPQVRGETTDRDYDDPLEWLVDSLTLDEGMMGGWKWLTPRSVWDRAGGYNPQLGLNNDFDFSIRLLLASRGVRFAPQAVYCYRKGISAALSQSRGRKAMTSALLTTLLGCQSLLAREDSARIRRLCADRLQMWLYEFFPEFPDLAAQAEQRIAELGGSHRPIQGGLLLKCVVPVLGWKLARRLQVAVRRIGWSRIQRWKQLRSLGRFK